MSTIKMKPEWDLLTTKKNIAVVPGSVEEYKAIKKERGLEGQKFLEKPEFGLLKDKVEVVNEITTLPDVPNHEFKIRIYRPKKSETKNLPEMLYFHGGFWVAGDANAEDLGCRAIIARGNKLVIVSFEYRLVGEVDWRTTFADAERAVNWLWHHAEKFGADVSKGFLVGGAEGGSHLAAISAIRARDNHPEVKTTGQVLIIPTTIAWPDSEIPQECRQKLRSHTEMRNAPVLDEELYEKLVDALKMSPEDKRKGENFPVWADLAGLPPAYLPMDECDPTRDQGFLYAELLRHAGVQTRVDYYEGLPNMFVQFPDLPTTLEAGGHLAAGVAWLLEGKNFGRG